MAERKYREWRGGKGDSRRSGENRTRFDLGMDMYNVALNEGKDSDEYKRLLKLWKAAQS